ncbi:MAG: adenylosuccinate lyase family protein, partial [Gammaproteobacteria bacterium]
MAVSPFDSQIYRQLLCDTEAAALFSDEAELRCMIQVEVALAQVQGELGLIPAASAKAIRQAAAKIEIDPAGLAAGTRRDGVPVPALVELMRSSVPSAEHAQYLHHGATSQDIMDSALMLRLRDVCLIIEDRLMRLLQALARQAETHAELPLAARTRAQIATPTSFGAVIAAWGAPLLSQLEALARLRPRLLRVSLAGASGNSAALGERAAELRGALAAALGLVDSEQPWHSDRTALAEFSSLCTRVGASLARVGEDYIEASRPEVGEILITAGGGSSTMPQKKNPVEAEMLVSLFHFAAAMDGLMTLGMLHRQQRDGVAWSLEWHALPQVCMATARALQLALELVENLQPDADAMQARLSEGQGLVYAEAISFRLAEIMPRPQAQARVKQMCSEAIDQKVSLA